MLNTIYGWSVTITGTVCSQLILTHRIVSNRIDWISFHLYNAICGDLFFFSFSSLLSAGSPNDFKWTKSSVCMQIGNWLIFINTQLISECINSNVETMCACASLCIQMSLSFCFFCFFSLPLPLSCYCRWFSDFFLSLRRSMDGWAACGECVHRGHPYWVISPLLLNYVMIVMTTRGRSRCNLT